MAALILYDRPDCHLCEQAMALIHAAGAGARCEQVDIEQDINLVRRYGLRIPVLRNCESGTELDWPFEMNALQAFLEDGQSGND